MNIDPRDLRILIVDDYKTMLRILTNLLGQMGFIQIDETLSAEEALERLHIQLYDLVIADWGMGSMSGLDLLKTIRATPEWRGIPFIMVTAENKADSVIAARNAGVTAYIIKPFNADTLRAKITTIFGPFGTSHETNS